jgi:hypothetical protein
MEETLTHLFLDCPFAQSSWGIFNLLIPQGSHFEVLESFKLQSNVNFFMDIIIMLRICLGYSQGKRIKKTSYVFMNRLHLVMLRFIFFSSLFFLDVWTLYSVLFYIYIYMTWIFTTLCGG